MEASPVVGKEGGWERGREGGRKGGKEGGREGGSLKKRNWLSLSHWLTCGITTSAKYTTIRRSSVALLRVSSLQRKVILITHTHTLVCMHIRTHSHAHTHTHTHTHTYTGTDLLCIKSYLIQS